LPEISKQAATPPSQAAITPSDKLPNDARRALWAWAGFVVVLFLAIGARWIKNQVYGIQELPFHIPGKTLEYPLLAAVVGLVANGILKATRLYPRLRPGFRTELYLKVGLVLLGATINFRLVLDAARGSILQALIMVTSVYFFCWWLAGKFGLAPTLRAVMSTAVSVCGVSAAIAAAGAVSAKKQEITYITALVVFTALPMMVLTPIMAGWMNLPQDVAGAWFGGNVDTTAAVIGAGTIFGETAQQVASIVKQTQNTLIGLVAFLLALYFTTVIEGKKERPSLMLIWQRFPKFVLGFTLSSLLLTLGLIPAAAKSAPFTAGNVIVAVKDWAFCLAFVSMGLEISLADFKTMGWKPVTVYLIVTIFNTLLALGVAWLVFGYWMPVIN